MIMQIRRFVLKKINIKTNYGEIVMFMLLCTIVILVIMLLTIGITCIENNEEIKKEKPRYRLIIVILVSPDNMKSRDMIRKTWLSERTDNIKHFFAIGTSDIESNTSETLESEQGKFNDLLLLPKLLDAYGTLTKKVLQALRKIHEDYEFDYLLKCDDDTFVLIHRILTDLDLWERKGTKKELYWGFFNGKAQVKRSGLWKESGWNICDYYLPYAVGGGYVLSYNLVKFISQNADSLRLFNSEDVSVGLWLTPVANVERRHDVRFDTEYRSRGCSNKYIITHKHSGESMRNLHDYYLSTGELCSKEIRSRMSYQYNWTVPPSQCCNRQAGII